MKAISNWVCVLALVVPALAWAEEQEAESGAKEDVAGFILHHVADSEKVEFEVPTRDDLNKEWELPRIRLSLSAGACEAHPEQHAVDALLNGCLDLSITKHVVMMWVGLLVLLLAAWGGGPKKKGDLVPHGTGANLLELLVLFVRDEIAVKTIGAKDAARFTPYLLTIFFFILFMNLVGLVPEFAPATGNLGVACGLAICTFVVTQWGAIRAAGLGGYLKHLTGGVHWGLWLIMIPVEVLGLFTKPFALTVRLFANMLAGHIVIFFLLGLIFILGSPAVAGFSVPFAAGIYFLELFVALVQAYIFAMLSGLFIGMGVAMGHHDAHEHAHAAEEVQAAH